MWESCSCIRARERTLFPIHLSKSCHPVFPRHWILVDLKALWSLLLSLIWDRLPLPQDLTLTWKDQWVRLREAALRLSNSIDQWRWLKRIITVIEIPNTMKMSTECMQDSAGTVSIRILSHSSRAFSLRLSWWLPKNRDKRTLGPKYRKMLNWRD